MTENKSLYLYAITPNDTTYELGSCGIMDGEVFSIAQGSVAAIVSRVGLKKIRPERKHLAAHNYVHRELNKLTSPIPVSFGIMADDASNVETILRMNQQPLIEKLNQIDGKMEMGLQVLWDVPDIFSYFVDQNPELKQVRDRLIKEERMNNRDDKIELGRLFNQLLDGRRQEAFEQVEAGLDKIADEIKQLDCRDEKLVMNLAILVSKKQDDAFEAIIEKTAAGFDDNYFFDYKGPFVPYNFSDLEIEF